MTKKDTGGIELRFDDAVAMLQCVHLITRLEGFGLIQAEGTASLPKKIGGNSEEFAMHVKGVDQGQQEPQLSSSIGLVLWSILMARTIAARF